MKHCCSKCGFETNRKSTLIKHLASKIPCDQKMQSQEDTEDRACAKCSAVYKSQAALLRHETICVGVHPLQCPTCKTVFKNACAKCRHIQKGGCEVGPSGNVNVSDQASVNMNNMNNVTTNNNSHNTTVVNITCTPEQKDALLPFMETDIEAVVKLVLKDPARFQLAMSSGALHQELCKVTHFGDIERNRNIFGIQAKGTQMTVLHNDKRCVMEKAAGIRQIMINNNTITSNVLASQYFKSKVVQPNRTRTTSQISNCVQNRGEYVPTIPFYGKVPTFVAPTKDYETAFDAFETALNNFYQVDEYELIVPFGHRACCHIIHYFKGNWWQSVNECGGWAECTSPKCLVDKCIHQFIDELIEHIYRTSPTDKYRAKDVNDAVEVIKFNKYVDLVIAKIVTSDFT